MIQKPKGTQDIIDNMNYYQFLKNIFKKNCSLFSFEEIKTPIFENKKLFTSSIGSSDIVAKEMFEFNDKKNRELVLRPENTAGIIRAYNEAKIYLPNSPTRWFYLGPMFRYERPQKGRFREFNQFGIEIIGDDSLLIDVEVILLAIGFLDEAKITNKKLIINTLGKIEERKEYIKHLKSFLNDKNELLCKDCQKRLDSNPLRILDCKLNSCKFNDVPKLSSFLGEDSKQKYQQLKKYLINLNIKFEEDPFLVRGLDYYSDTIFEVVMVDNNKSQNALLGGGRYSSLSEKIGGTKVSGCGFAIGVERIIDALKDEKISIKKPQPLDVYIICENIDKSRLLKIATLLRRNNISAAYDFFNSPLKKQFKKLEKKSPLFAMILSNDNEELIIKNQKTGKKSKITLQKLIKDWEEIKNEI